MTAPQSEPSSQVVEPSASGGALEPCYTLKAASEKFFQRKVSPETMRQLHKDGKLRIARIGRTDFVTESALVSMWAACELPAPGHRPSKELAPCHAAGSRLDSTLESALDDHQSGLFSTERKRLAQAQALTTLKRLTAPSKPISRKCTGHQVVRIGRTNSSSRK
jgi:hypothetical protein